ncbi:MAG: LuxR C-terminal-related transcriptional regulator [Pseudomonadota bacterium]
MTERLLKFLPTTTGVGNPSQEAKVGVRQSPLVTTKLRPPFNKAKLIERARLVETLGQTLAHKLVLIHGPAGFGKTTLATQWYARLSQEGAVVAWLSVDASDNDLERLLAYVVEAIRAVEPDIGSGLAQVIESNPGNAAEFVLGSLINEFELYDQEFVLFLDDWHLISEPKIHEALELFLSRVPPNFHLIVASRTRVGLPLARLRVQNELIEINATDLRFDYEESSMFLSNTKALELSPVDLATLWRSTEGWVAALQLAAISLRRVGNRESLLHWASGTPRDIGEYLAENVLASLPNDMIDFMLKTSLLGRLSPGLCNAVTGRQDSAHILDALERQDLFLLPLDEDRQWFRYHHLFARFLQRKLERDFPTLTPSLHLAASAWFSLHGQTMESLGHALAAGEKHRAIDLVERDAMSLVQNSYMGSLLGLVSQLPKELLVDRPLLQTAIAWANCLTHHLRAAEEALSHVARIAANAAPLEKKLLTHEADVIRACIAIYADKIDDVEIMVQPCLDSSSEYPPWVVGVAANILTYRYIHTFQFDKIPPLQNWAREFQDRAQGVFSAVYGRCFSGLAAYWSGNLPLGKKHFLDAFLLAQDTAGKDSHAAHLSGSLLGQVKYEMNELEEAEQLLQDSRILGFEGGVVDFYMATFISSARLMVLKGDRGAASIILKEGQETAKQVGLTRLGVAVACEQARISLLAGDIHTAERILDSSHFQQYTGEPPAAGIEGQIWDSLQVANARLLCEQGHPEQAIAILRIQSERARATGRMNHEIAVSVLLTIALSLSGNESGAEDVLTRAVTEGVSLGFVRIFLDEGQRIIGLLERLRENARRHEGVSEALSEVGAAANQLLAASRTPAQGLRLQMAMRRPTPRLNSGDDPKLPFDDRLKGREIEILKLIDQGHSNKEIARVLSISVDTVKWYLKSIFNKLCVARRGQAIAEARRLQLLDKA